MDERGTNGSAPARVEQEDDDESGVANIRDPVQLAADVRERQVREKSEAGAAEEGLYRRPGHADGLDEYEWQQQQQLLQVGARDGTPAAAAAKHEAVEHRRCASADPRFQPVRAQLLPGLRHRIPDSGQHDPPAAAERKEQRPLRAPTHRRRRL